jgi:SAM-dependent methyltransferase
MDGKAEVRDFWDRASCGEDLYLAGQDASDFDAQAAGRYRLEPYIADFARFDEAKGKSVLEIGVGLGADHERFARAGAKLSGIDLTPRAITNTKSRFAAHGLESDLRVGDAEALPFADDSFDIVYSWGVIHHSPQTHKAAGEILRVLKPGGRFSVMIYQRHSMVGYMLWLRYALAAGKPFTSLDTIYAAHLESPGTKAYSPAQAKALFASATNVRVSSVLTHGDLLEGAAGQRHEGKVLAFARTIWPRRLIKALLPNHGLFLMIDGIKPKEA